MNRCESVPLGRILKHLPENGTWLDPAYQGPDGLYAVRVTAPATSAPMFQVCRIFKGQNPPDEPESEPFLTHEGADRFAQSMAGGGSPAERMA